MMCSDFWIVSNRPFPNSVASNPAELDRLIKSHEPETPKRIYSPFWSWKVPHSILEQCQCIGFHSAPLPRGKGGSPIQNMIRLGYCTTEICAFKMTDDFDGGEVIARHTISLDGTLGTIIERISHIIKNMINRLERNGKYNTTISGIYNNIPDKFKRIVDNTLVETDTLECLYDEIRMRDEKNHPKAFIYHGKHAIEFTNAAMKEGEIIANVRIIQT